MLTVTKRSQGGAVNVCINLWLMILLLAGYPRNRPQGRIYVQVVYDVLRVSEKEGRESSSNLRAQSRWRELWPDVWGLLKCKSCLQVALAPL